MQSLSFKDIHFVEAVYNQAMTIISGYFINSSEQIKFYAPISVLKDLLFENLNLGRSEEI
jgi:hypothetical protein